MVAQLSNGYVPKMISCGLNNYSAHSTLTKSKGQLISRLTHINRFLSASPVGLTTNATSCCTQKNKRVNFIRYEIEANLKMKEVGGGS